MMEAARRSPSGDTRCHDLARQPVDEKTELPVKLKNGEVHRGDNPIVQLDLTIPNGHRAR